MAARKNMHCRIIDPTKHTSNIIFVITHSEEYGKV
jgi:hypothetical protein